MVSNRKLVSLGLVQALATFLVCALAIWLEEQVQKWEGPGDGYFDDVSLLLVFVTTALVSAVLVLGYPLYLLFQKQIREGFLLLISTGGWLILIAAGAITAVVLGVHG